MAVRAQRPPRRRPFAFAFLALEGDRFVMVWPTFDQRIVARIFDAAGVPVSDEIDVDTGVPYLSYNGSPVVARRGDGFIVAWLEVGLRRVFARIFAADGASLGGAVELFIYGAGYPNPDRLQVVGDGEGPMALVLTSSVFVTGRWFDPQSGPLGDAFPIASLTDVEFRLTITDRETSDTAVFDNPPFHLASAGHSDVFGDDE